MFLYLNVISFRFSLDAGLSNSLAVFHHMNKKKNSNPKRENRLSLNTLGNARLLRRWDKIDKMYLIVPRGKYVCITHDTQKCGRTATGKTHLAEFKPQNFHKAFSKWKYFLCIACTYTVPRHWNAKLVSSCFESGCVLIGILCWRQTFHFSLGWSWWSCSVVLLVGFSSRSNTVHGCVIALLRCVSLVCVHSNLKHVALFLPRLSWFFLHLIVHAIRFSLLFWVRQMFTWCFMELKKLYTAIPWSDWIKAQCILALISLYFHIISYFYPIKVPYHQTLKQVF